MLTVGDKLPEFKLNACVSLRKGEEFAEISNANFRGKWAVLFFWPLDFTFVCPTEIAEFGRLNDEFKKRDAMVVGASVDSQYSHLAWRKEATELYDLPIPMLADLKRELCSQLGILHKDAGVALRATFIADPEGTIRYASVHDLSTGRNVPEVLRSLDALQCGELCPVNWEKGQATLKS